MYYDKKTYDNILLLLSQLNSNPVSKGNRSASSLARALSVSKFDKSMAFLWFLKRNEYSYLIILRFNLKPAFEALAIKPPARTISSLYPLQDL